MTATYAIKDWDRVFSVSQQARVKGELSWLAFPIRLLGDHYRELMKTGAGREAYTVFVALCCVAANCPTRGKLEDSDGAPITLRALHHRTGIPESELAKGITLLASPEVGWLVQIGACSERTPSVLGAIGEERRRENTKPPLPPLELPRSLEPCRSDIECWLEYKRERGERYKPKGLAGLIARLESWGPNRVRAAVKASTASNYAGLFEPKPETVASRNGVSYVNNPAEGAH